MFNKRYTIDQGSYKKPATTVKKERVKEVLNRDLPKLQDELEDVHRQIRELRARKNELTKKINSLKQATRPNRGYKTFSLYALKLEDGYWYVGITRNVEKRYKQHGTRHGSRWTKLHKPMCIHEVRPTDIILEAEAAKLENAMTIEYAIMYGADKVRGGGFCQTKPRWPKEVQDAISEQYQSDLASFYRRNF